MPQAKRQKKEETVERYGMTMLNEAELDFCSLGALVHRLDLGIVPWRKASKVDIHVSGGGFNCSANLADCFGLKTAVCTAMVNYPVGNLIAERVRAMGVKPIYKHFEHNGVNGPNMATVRLPHSATITCIHILVVCILIFYSQRKYRATHTF